MKQLLCLLTATIALTFPQVTVWAVPKHTPPPSTLAHCKNRAYAMPLNNVAISPDGKTLFSSIFESSISQWDLTTGKLVKTLSGHQDTIYALALSPNGKYLASGSSDGTIRVWLTANGTLVRSLKSSANALKISPDGQLLASNYNNMVKLWRLETGELLKSLSGRDREITSLDFTPDSKILASGSFETVTVWHIVSGRVLHTLTWKDPNVSSGFAMLVITPDGRSVIAGPSLTQFGYKQNAIYRWDLATGQLDSTLEALLGDWVNGIAVTPDGKTLVTGNFGITLWDLTSGKKTYESPASHDDPTGLAISPDGKTLAIVTQWQGLKLWDLASRQFTRVLLPNCPTPSD
jgi:WD40 repeat protein